MPPNQKGGKGYKKGKHNNNANEIDVKMISWDTEDGQMLGRVTKSVGNRRFRVYCNDNHERTCRLAGHIRKSEWVGEGSIVVLSLRGLSSASNNVSNADDLGDILQLVDPRLYGKLKKMVGVNEVLFAQVEAMDVEKVQKRVAAGGSANEEDDLFDRNDGSNVKDDDLNINDI